MHKFDSLDEIDKFLEKYKLPKLTRDKIDTLNNVITIKGIELYLESLQRWG